MKNASILRGRHYPVHRIKGVRTISAQIHVGTSSRIFPVWDLMLTGHPAPESLQSALSKMSVIFAHFVFKQTLLHRDSKCTEALHGNRLGHFGCGFIFLLVQSWTFVNCSDLTYFSTVCFQGKETRKDVLHRQIAGESLRIVCRKVLNLKIGLRPSKTRNVNQIAGIGVNTWTLHACKELNPFSRVM